MNDSYMKIYKKIMLVNNNEFNMKFRDKCTFYTYNSKHIFHTWTQNKLYYESGNA